MPCIETVLAPFSVYQQHIKDRHFVKALSRIPDSQWLISSKRRWVCARLGIFSPIVAAGWNGYSIRSGVVYTEALSAYGRMEECQEVLKRIDGRFGFDRYREELIREFSKYNLPLAIKIIEKIPASQRTLQHQALKLAYLHTQDVCHLDAQTNKDWLDSYRQKRLKNRFNLLQHPDLLLLDTNLLAQSNMSKLSYLNQYQKLYNLPQLALINKTATLNSLNIELKSPIRHLNLSHLPLLLKTTESNLYGTRDNALEYKVTIIVTSYNAASHLHSTLNSLLQQSWQNIEIILVDDASTDKSLSIAKVLASRDSRLTILSQKINQGTYVAKNYALTLATGNFIICHDSDDWAHPLKVEEHIMPLLLDNRLMATTSSWIKLDNDGNFVARTGYPYKLKNPSSLCFRRQTIDLLNQTVSNSGIWQAVRTGADSELYERFKLIFGKDSIRHIKKPLTIGAHRNDSLMNAKNSGTKDLTARIKRLQYWETWRREHIEMVRSGKLTL